MTRSPLAYPLNRSADQDAGGAADLQTDIMRFMAILSLCLVAIFALVQSIPMQPTQSTVPVAPAERSEKAEAATPVNEQETAVSATVARPAAEEVTDKPAEPAITLTRPKWVPRYEPAAGAAETIVPTTVPTRDDPVPAAEATPSPPIEDAAAAVESEADGFTLRFESDAALTRLVAANRIGVYAIASGRAQRMTVRENRISFWDASTPNTYHEMETTTVPAAVIDALGRAGTLASDVNWGVTLPGRLKSRLDALMLEHRGGALIIVSSGDIRWEAS